MHVPLLILCHQRNAQHTLIACFLDAGDSLNKIKSITGASKTLNNEIRIKKAEKENFTLNFRPQEPRKVTSMNTIVERRAGTQILYLK